MKRLLRATAEAEARHFWFRGFRAFVGPLVEIATAGRPAPLILTTGRAWGRQLDPRQLPFAMIGVKPYDLDYLLERVEQARRQIAAEGGIDERET